MKRLFALLIALIIVLCAAARAEFSQEELLGVWVRDDDPNVVMVFLPGEYARHFGANAVPELFAEVTWRDTDEWTLLYRMNVGRNLEGTQLLPGNSFFGTAINSLAGNIIGRNTEESESYTAFKYDSGTINGLFFIEESGLEGSTYFTISDNPHGIIYFYFDEERCLNWFDDSDPHTYTRDFYRAQGDAPEPEVLVEQVLRPIINMAEGGAPDIIDALIAFVREHQLARTEVHQLEARMKDAFAALSAEEAQTFADHFPSILEHMTVSAILLPLTYEDESKIILPGAEDIWGCHMLRIALEEAAPIG